ncbi:MAG: ABC transporter ATP-binding protein [Tissierellia bacterium]|nr:ABC transporter ATP-binding protein [Tissierellia bacterium]
MNNILEVKNLNFYYGKNPILKDINFQLETGDYLGIIGPNGSGKTTLIKILLGLIGSYDGEVKYKEELLGKNFLGYVPQKTFGADKLFPATVKEIVATGLLAHKKGIKLYTKEDYKKVDSILAKLKIEDLKNRKIGNLSGGQQQRVLLARSMVAEPSILILDEPTSALDPEIRDEFYRILKELNEEGVSVILISHDLMSIDNYINKILFLDRTVIYYGAYERFKVSEEINRYFGTFIRD